MATQSRSGLVSATVLAMVLVGAVSGTIVGLVISGGLANQVVLAFICALVAAVLTLGTGYLALGRNTRASLPPGVVLWNVVVSSVIGGLAGHELSIDLREPPASPLVGGISGVLASVLIVSFLVTAFILRQRLPDTQG